MALIVVIDANVGLATALPLPYSADADRHIEAWKAERATLVVPVLWTYEVVSGLRRALLEKFIDDSRLQEALDLMDALDLELVNPSFELNRAALVWADRLSHRKAYDGHYLAVAEHLGAQFWTADKRLSSSLADRGVAWAHWIGEN